MRGGIIGAMRVGERVAWLTACAAALGVAVVSCKRDAPVDPALAVHEITPSSSVQAAASAPVIDAVDASPEASVPLADASFDASPVKKSGPKPDSTVGLGGLGTIGGIGHNNGSCGASASCGATAGPRGPTAAVSLSISGAVGTDDAKIRSRSAHVRQCATRGLESDPSMQGSLTLLVQIDVAGSATVTTQSNNGLSAAVASCMAGTLRQLEFDKTNARSLTVRVLQAVQ